MNAQQIDPWRLRCPEGDTSFKRRQSGLNATAPVYCTSCLRRGDDPHHDHLIDIKTGDEVQL
jgi:hypothetical protein